MSQSEETMPRVRLVGDGKREIFDRLRGRYVALTPEEYVRQRFVHLLISSYGYMPALMANEVSLQVGKLSRRADTVVYHNSLRPLLLIEYKAESVALTPEVLEQALRYNATLGVLYIIITNGKRIACFRRLTPEDPFEMLRSIPSYAEVQEAGNKFDAK